MERDHRMTVAALIVAAGRGVRAGEGLPKQYRSLGGRTILARTLEAFVEPPRSGHDAGGDPSGRRGTLSQEPFAAFSRIFESACCRLLMAAKPGRIRSDWALRHLVEVAPDMVLVHDAARPFVDAAFIDRAIAAGRSFGAAVPGSPVTDTIKIVDERAKVIATPDRATLRAVQTPQAFRFGALLDAHRKAADRGSSRLHR